MTERIRVLVVDDHTIVRSGVRLLLEAENDLEIVGEAGDGAQALALVESLQPDVVVIDVAMPGMDGIEATRQIKARWPNINVLALTMHRTDEYFFAMLKAGASGYILKGAETSELINAVHTVGRGEIFLHATMARRLVQDYLSRAEGTPGLEVALSPREKEILRLLAEGYSNNEIAQKLVISASTVHTHRSNIMTKLGLSGRHELIQYARERGLVQGL